MALSKTTSPQRLHEKFTAAQLSTLSSVFACSMSFMDQFHQSTVAFCHPLEYAIVKQSNDAALVWEALEYLGVVNHFGEPTNFYLMNGYFCKGPSADSKPFKSWTNDSDYYARYPGWELIERVARIFDWESYKYI